MSSRGYAAGRTLPTDLSFNLNPVGPNALAESSNIGRIKARSRMLEADNAIYGGALETHVSHIVGRDGIGSRADTGDAELNEQIDELITWAARAVDKDRRQCLRDSQELFYRELWQGECGVRWMLADHGDLAAAPAIELVEDARIDFSFTTTTDEGNRVREGVEFDAEGKVVAYHVYRDDPTDNVPGAQTSNGSWFARGDAERIPATEMDLVLIPKRLRQIRGLPRMMSATLPSRQLGEFKHDTTVQARIATLLGVFFSGDDGTGVGVPGGDNDQAAAYDAAGNPITKLVSGMVGFLRGNRDMKVVQPSIPGPQFEPFTRSCMRDISRSARTSYADLSGDGSQQNYSSLRAEHNTLRTFHEQMMMLIWRRHTEPWRRRVINWGIANGYITLDAEMRRDLANPIKAERMFRCHVDLPPQPYVNPQQEAAAYGEDLENGVRSTPGVIRRLGLDPKAVIREEAEHEAARQAEYEKHGLAARKLRENRVPTPPADDTPPEPSNGQDDEENNDGGRGSLRLAGASS